MENTKKETKFYYNVRYGKMALIDLFEADKEYAREANCIVKTDRGTEWGSILNPVEKESRNTQGKSNNKNGSLLKILRAANTEDIKKRIYIEEVHRPDEYAYCKEQIKKLNLQMKLVDVDHLIGDEKIIFYFYSPVRVDFRELVKSLVRKFNSSIELRQIGARDTAREQNGVGSCGRNLCCSTWKKDLGGITYEMAQSQFSNPEQQMLIGLCGKLKCCLKYEYENYVRSIKILPTVGTRLKIEDKEGIVISRNLGMAIVTIEDKEGNKHTFSVESFTGNNKRATLAKEQNINNR